MEQDNQKEKVISIGQAKEIIRQHWHKATDDGMHYIWCGDKIEEYRGGYLMPVCPLKTGVEKPTKRAWIDCTTGETGMTFDLTAQDCIFALPSLLPDLFQFSPTYVQHWRSGFRPFPGLQPRSANKIEGRF